MKNNVIITREYAEKILTYMTKKAMDFKTARKFIEYLNINGGSVVMHDAFPIVSCIIPFLYNPDDKGANGKCEEVIERLTRWYENNRPCCRWHELHAKRNGQSDMNSRKQEEMKTGAGDWLYSHTGTTRTEIINEYRNRESLIYWKTEYFIIRCSWRELFDYMDTYNDKGVEQFFKTCIKYNPQVNKAVCQLQEWKTSKKKIAFFKSCPYNMEK